MNHEGVANTGSGLAGLSRASHQRVTNTDRAVQDAMREFGVAGESKVTYFIAANFRQAGLGERGKQ
jgi:hypothetical protein